jgi:hypothetical protein
MLDSIHQELAAMKKLVLIALTTVFGLVSAGSFAADASATQAPTPKVEAKSSTIHKTHLKKKSASKPAEQKAASKPAAQKAQAAKKAHTKHKTKKHHHKTHHQYHKTAKKAAPQKAQSSKHYKTKTHKKGHKKSGKPAK